MSRSLSLVLGLFLVVSSSFGCATAVDEEFDEGSGALGDEPARSGLASCAASLAKGTYTPSEKAFLDVIAFAEDTSGHGEDGYNVIGQTHALASDCNQHPNRPINGTTAAGRYSILHRTWKALGLPNFNPDNQDRAAMALIERRGVVLPHDAPMTEAEFQDALEKVSPEWASLPPSKYGNKTKPVAELRAVYCRRAGGCR